MLNSNYFTTAGDFLYVLLIHLVRDFAVMNLKIYARIVAIFLDDRRKILFFNTKGTIVNVSKKTSDLLKYMETKQITGEFTKRLEDDVFKARQNKEWMEEYMKTLVHNMDVRNEGREEGRILQLVELV